MKKEDFQTESKIFCESISVAFTPEYFIVGIASGSQNKMYTITPQHAKRFQQYLKHQVDDFEKKHGEIKAEWVPGVVSPVQMDRKDKD